MYNQIISLFASFKVWLLQLIGLFIIWFEPARELAIMLVVFVLVDAVLDIWVAVDKQEKMNFKAFLTKKIKDITLFLIYILVIHYFQTSYLKEDLTIFKLMVGIPLVALFSGIVENIEHLTGIKVATQTKEVLTNVFGKLSQKIIDKKDDINQ